ncbi:MAG: bacillithiol biosynthesis cysteine-adding enzyme BshC [Betaproteobacteria bacterium]
MSENARETLAFESLDQPLSPLFLDYLAGRERAAAFLGKDGFDLGAIERAADRTLRLERPRSALAEALVRQQRARSADRAAELAGLLARPDTVAIVTGQQAGLFGGPLYVLLKAIATLEVARLLEERRGRPVVPVFWVASDDHDFAEVRSDTVLDATGAIRTLRYDPRREPAGEPAWAITLDDTLPSLTAELARVLPAGMGRDAVMDAVGRSYLPGESLSGAFARFVSLLLPELVVLDPADPALKALSVDVLGRELREGSPVSRLALETGEKLLAAGYHQQVPVRPGFLQLFVVAEGQRRALGIADGSVEVRGTRERLSLDEAAARLASAPQLWSAAALLRPLVQDFLLPTAAYVGGPAEIAYHAQLAPSYAHFGIPRPALVPRPSATLVEPQQARALDAEGLRLADLVGDPETLVTRWAREDYPAVETAFARAREAIERELGVVEETLGAHDPTLRAATVSARGRALHQVEGLHEKALRALKKRDQGRAERLRRTRDALLPGGALQERGIGLASPLARHGLALVDALRRRLDFFARGHQVIRL